MNSKDKDILIKHVALFSIYLIISLIFITARAFAVLNYDISGEDGVQGFARPGSDDGSDIISINTTSDGNVSFLLSDSQELPLDCVINSENASTGKFSCRYTFSDSQIDTTNLGSNNKIEFTLKQNDGSPTLKKGQIYIDGAAPRSNNPEFVIAERNGTGILFKYSFTDYYSDTQADAAGPVDPSDCVASGASGIGYIELNLQGKTIMQQTISTQNCTVSGEYYASMTGMYNDKITYYMNVEDRLGNRAESGLVELNGTDADFKAPVISNTFKIQSSGSSGEEINGFSTQANIESDVIITVDDANLDVNNVYADLSSLNSNTAVNIPYKNIQGTCAKNSNDTTDTEYTCTFSNIQVRPEFANLNISITAGDIVGNVATKSLVKSVRLIDDAGTISYIGPLQEHCTSDLTQCYLKPGAQLLRVILDSSSSFNNTLINLGVDSDQTFALCKLNTTGGSSNDKWVCNGIYKMPDSGTVNLFLASAYDDYGNILESDMNRNIEIDNVKPLNLSDVSAVNSNNNDCEVYGDDLVLNLKVREATPELKMYMNTTNFTTQDTQYGTCIFSDESNGSNTDWDCSLTLTDFVSSPMSAHSDLILEDLAGNQLKLPQNFSICQSSTAAVPNVISGITQGIIPNIDRKTASYISVITYVPLTFTVKNSASLIYLNVEKCTAIGMTGLDVMGSGSYFIPAYGTTPILALNIGHSGAQLVNGTFDVNCTITARVRTGATVYTKEQRKSIIVKVTAYNNPLGTIDNATLSQINDVKKHIRDVDSDIATFQKWEDILGKICNIAETIGKMNSLLQDVKTVLYGVCVVLKAIPASSIASDLWKAVNKPLSQFHKIVDKYIWPPGTMPTLSIGSLVKTTCMVYTCKEYDIGTYTGLMTDLTTTGAIGVLGDKNGVGITTGDTKYEDGTRVHSYQTYVDMSSDSQDSVLHTNDIVIDSLNGHQWIVNPYKSVHYDDICPPAILYNDKKDRQISCMYLRCLNEQSKSGIPKIVCDGNYKINKCLYLDSAEYLLSGHNIWTAFVKGMGDALENALPGLGIQTVYIIACKNYYGKGNDLVTGWRSALCGIAGALMSTKEIINAFNNPFYSTTPQVPSPDYCNGLDYKDTSNTGTNDNLGDTSG